MSLSDGLDELYREIILDHYRNPRNRGRLPNPTVATQGSNPLCGDELELSLLLAGDQIEGIKIQGRGCSISQASASMMTEALKGLSLAEAEQVAAAFKDMMLANGSADGLGDLEALQGVKKYPVRIKCALLAWNTFLEGLAEHRSKE